MPVELFILGSVLQHRDFKLQTLLFNTRTYRLFYYNITIVNILELLRSREMSHQQCCWLKVFAENSSNQTNIQHVIWGTVRRVCKLPNLYQDFESNF